MGLEISKPIVCGVPSSGNGFGNFQTFSLHKYSIAMHGLDIFTIAITIDCCKCQTSPALAIAVKSVNSFWNFIFLIHSNTYFTISSIHSCS